MKNDDAGLPPGTRSGRYYSCRPSPVASAYGENDWKAAVDPDGKSRDRTQERSQHLEDLSHELDFVNALTPGRILDIGCGLGFFLSGVENTWEKHGIEMSQFAVSAAGKWGRVVMGPVEDAGFSSEHFDAVIMHHVIEHIEDPQRTITEVRRLLAPGGCLILGTPDFDGACARRFGPRYRLLHDPTHISLFSNESMHRFLRDHGFLIENVDYPFFDTRHFTEENLLRLLDEEGVSPPFYGSFMTFYCRKPEGGALTAVLQRLGSFAPHELLVVDQAAATAVRLAVAAVERGGRVLIDAGRRTAWLENFAIDLWQNLSHDSGSICPLEAVGPDANACEEDVTLCFRLDEEGRPPVADQYEGESTIVFRRAPAGGRGPALKLDVPLLHGQTSPGTEVSILGAIVQELWSRRFESHQDIKDGTLTLVGGDS